MDKHIVAMIEIPFQPQSLQIQFLECFLVNKTVPVMQMKFTGTRKATVMVRLMHNQRTMIVSNQKRMGNNVIANNLQSRGLQGNGNGN